VTWYYHFSPIICVFIAAVRAAARGETPLKYDILGTTPGIAFHSNRKGKYLLK
jgi:hypothetical protein